MLQTLRSGFKQEPKDGFYLIAVRTIPKQDKPEQTVWVQTTETVYRKLCLVNLFFLFNTLSYWPQIFETLEYHEMILCSMDLTPDAVKFGELYTCCIIKNIGLLLRQEKKNY